MSTKSVPFRLGSFVPCFVWSCCAVATLCGGDSYAADELFAARPEVARGAIVTAGPEVLRGRGVHVDTTLLEARISSGDSLTLNLFDDERLELVIERFRTNDDGTKVWRGRILGDRLSSATLIEQGGLVEAEIRAGHNVFRVRSFGDSYNVVEQIDERGTGECGGNPLDSSIIPLDRNPSASERSRDGQTLEKSSEQSEANTVVDILVVYTANALAHAGSVSSMERRIALGTEILNEAFIDSQIPVRARVVHSRLVEFDERVYEDSDTRCFHEGLDALMTPDDGVMDEVHALRQEYCADLVALIVRHSSLGGISAGYRVTPERGFSVTDVVVLGSYVFGHEVGHNLYAMHDWYVYDDTNTYLSVTYNRGYYNRAESFRTIMSYDRGCFGCRMFPQFSNPDVLLDGIPSGVPEGTSTACVEGNRDNPPCDADNSKIIRLTAPVVSDYFESCVPGCGNNVIDTPEEECDAVDDAACPGACKTDCMCPFCGDFEVNQDSETCDDGRPTSRCDADCTAVECGDEVINYRAEHCEPGDDAACPGLCNGCTCEQLGYFVCRRTKHEQPIRTSLSDEFDSGTYSGGVVKTLCAPTRRGSARTYDGKMHLESVKIIGPHEPRSSLHLSTVVGTHLVDTVSTDSLLLPTSAAASYQDPVQPPDPESFVDRYRCVRAKTSRNGPKPAKGLRAVSTNRVFSLKKPTRLCVPTDREGAGIKHADNKLLCFKAKSSRKYFREYRDTINELGEGELRIRAAVELCLPARELSSCGDGVVNGPGEQCDGADLGTCGSAGCDPDCSCGPADECADAVDIDALPFTDIADTRAASVSQSDPAISCGSPSTSDTSASSVWYRFTARYPARVVARTAGSDYPTRMAMFTGDCGALEEQSCVAGSARGDLTSISFDAVPGQTYYFLVTNAPGAKAGTLVFNVET